MNEASQHNDRQRTKNVEWTGEEGRRPLPLDGYATLLGLFGLSLTGVMAWATRNDKLLEEVTFGDLVVLAGGTQKLARAVSKERITTVLRQPFTDYHGTEGALPGETKESVRRDGGQLRQAIGELLCCPYCMSTWSALALTGTYLANRKLGRTVAAFLTTVSLAEIAQRLYRDAVEG